MPLTVNNANFKAFLDEKAAAFNTPAFIGDDPLSVPHKFREKQDIEISGFFAAVLAWGNRKTIINNCTRLMALMDNAPYDFCLHHSATDLKKMTGFVHRTFNSDDLLYFIAFLKYHFSRYDSLEDAFFKPGTSADNRSVATALNSFYDYFFSLPCLIKRTRKHLAAPENGSACKRLNMFLRWMVRNDGRGVDFGIWNSIKPAVLICPLDVHVARVARHFGLLERKQNDWAAATELTGNLRRLDPEDPVKYDFALFGLGISEKY